MNDKNFIKKIIKNWHKVYLFLSVSFIVFIYGVLVGNYHLFPFKIFQNAKLAAEDWIKDDNYKQYLNIRPERFIFPARHDGNGVTINSTDKTFDGYTLITSMWNDSSGFKLINVDGTEIHNWRVSYNIIFPSTDSTKNQLSDWDVDIHGSVVYPNGDIVFNFNRRGLVKIDKNSNTIWALKADYHHSVFKDADGNLWVPDAQLVTQNDEDFINRFPLLKPPYTIDYICKISPNGEVLKRIALLDIFYNSGMESLLFADGIRWFVDKVGNDITHLNDIDVLGSDLANKFPLFQAGDIMVSMRVLNLIMIIDQKTELIKWYMVGPFFRQHDPDFTKDGDIIVFDNRSDHSDGEILGGSRIIRANPLTRNGIIEYQGDYNNKFYTEIAGKQQLLPNGNILIAEHGAGRVFEVSNKGKIVWTYINRYDDDEVYSITDAIRLSRNYLTFLR